MIGFRLKSQATNANIDRAIKPGFVFHSQDKSKLSFLTIGFTLLLSLDKFDLSHRISLDSTWLNQKDLIMNLSECISIEFPCWPASFYFIAQDPSGEIHAFISKPRFNIAINKWVGVLRSQLVIRTIPADDWNSAIISQAEYLNRNSSPLRVLMFGP